MSDETTTEPESPEMTAEERLAAARQAFQDAQRFMPPGSPPIVEPPHIELMATVNALSDLLAKKGIIAEQEMIDAKTGEWASLVERLVEIVNNLKRDALKASIVAGTGSRRPL